MNSKRQKITILKAAANRIASRAGSLCCMSIREISPSKEIEEACIDIITSIFKKDSTRVGSLFWWDIHEIEPRIFALLLAAEMVRTDSLP